MKRLSGFWEKIFVTCWVLAFSGWVVCSIFIIGSLCFGKEVFLKNAITFSVGLFGSYFETFSNLNFADPDAIMLPILFSLMCWTLVLAIMFMLLIKIVVSIRHTNSRLIYSWVLFELILFLMVPSPLKYYLMVGLPVASLVLSLIFFYTIVHSPKDVISWRRKIAREKDILKKAKLWPDEDIRPRFIPPVEPVDENWFLERCPDILRCVSLADDEKARCLIWSLKNLLPEVSYRVASEMLYRLRRIDREASLTAVINNIVDLHREDQRWLGYFLREFSSEGTYGLVLSIEISSDYAVAFYNQIAQAINLVQGEAN